MTKTISVANSFPLHGKLPWVFAVKDRVMRIGSEPISLRKPLRPQRSGSLSLSSLAAANSELTT